MAAVDLALYHLCELRPLASVLSIPKPKSLSREELIAAIVELSPSRYFNSGNDHLRGGGSIAAVGGALASSCRALAASYEVRTGVDSTTARDAFKARVSDLETQVHVLRKVEKRLRRKVQDAKLKKAQAGDAWVVTKRTKKYRSYKARREENWAALVELVPQLNKAKGAVKVGKKGTEEVMDDVMVVLTQIKAYKSLKADGSYWNASRDRQYRRLKDRLQTIVKRF